jgi:hypothetical protein
MTYVTIAICFNFMLRISNVVNTSKGAVGHAYLNDEVSFECNSGLFFLAMDIHRHINQPADVCSIVFTQFSSKSGKGQGLDHVLTRLIPEESLLIDDVVSFCLRKGTYGTQDIFFSRTSNGKTKRMTSKMVNNELKLAARHFNLPDDHFSTHSIRIGASTEVLHSGAGESVLQATGGWKSLTVARQYPEKLPGVMAITSGQQRVQHSDLLRLAKQKGIHTPST